MLKISFPVMVVDAFFLGGNQCFHHGVVPGRQRVSRCPRLSPRHVFMSELSAPCLPAEDRAVNFT